MKTTKIGHLAAASALSLTAFALSTRAANTPAPAKAKMPVTKVAATVTSSKASAPKPSAQEMALANGTWTLDPMHSTIGFAVHHMGLNDVHGTFDEFTGTIIANSHEVGKSSVDFVAKTTSVNTRIKMRDDHLRGADFFDVAKFPEMTFKSTAVRRSETNPRAFHVTGNFTLHGVTKKISFPFYVAGPVNDNWGSFRGGIKANLVINREDYGVGAVQKMPNGALLIDNLIRVNLDLEAVRPDPAYKPAPAPAK